MNKLIGLFTLLIFFNSCKLEGVEETEITELQDGIIENSLKDRILEEKPLMLSDSINGEANEMVFQREDGLRVEWDVKNVNRPIELNDVVMVNYTARVAAGEVYDSNEKLGKPVPLKTNVGMMVRGWEEGLLEMHEGDQGRIMIPAALAYGENGYTTIIPPKADIIVDIEIIEIIDPEILEDGVKVYKWEKGGTGATPQKNQIITFDYFAYKKGKNGGLYDNSYQNEAAFSFKYKNSNVVDGLHIGMSILKAGENAFIEIPSKSAYGSAGLQDLVPKNTDIVYDVRIESIL